jgi:hypothetical protein
MRWLAWRCATTVTVFDEPWWSATTLAVLCSSRRM